MAEIKWNKVGECLFETDDANANFTACINTISKAFGLTLESETSTVKYCKMESLSNGGIIIKLSGTSTMTFDSAYYTQENGTFTTITTYIGGNVPLNNNKYGIRCYKIEMGDHSIYLIKKVENNINGYNVCCFGISSLTDYFSNKTCDVIMGSYQSEYINGVYAYEKTTKKYLPLTKVCIGGSSYPTEAKGITVAIPIFWQNAYNYGYLGKSPDLYELYPSISIGLNNLHALGTQFQINGQIFERISSDLFVRTG